MPGDPVSVRCHLCGESIPAITETAFYRAVDHALDNHRAELLAAPDSTRDMFSIGQRAATKRPVRVHPHGWVWR
jgi:hypothetical protein